MSVSEITGGLVRFTRADGTSFTARLHDPGPGSPEATRSIGSLSGKERDLFDRLAVGGEEWLP